MHLSFRLMQRQNVGRRMRKLRPLFPPVGIEYQRASVNYARFCERAIREQLLVHLAGLLGQQLAPTTRADDLSDSLDAIIRKLRLIMEAGGINFLRTVQRLIANVEQQHARNFVEAYGAALPGINPMIGAEPWLREHTALALQENARLIKTIPEQLLGEVQRVVNQGAMNGLEAADIAKQIEGRFGVTESTARRIARDQTSKWHSSVNRLRCVDAGVIMMEWSTSLDDRVRPKHRKNHGLRFPIDEPPADTGHAGHEVNCRCCEIPVIEEYEKVAKGQDAQLGWDEARAERDRRLAAE